MTERYLRQDPRIAPWNDPSFVTSLQHPELWRLFKTRLAPGEGIRVFRLSKWTEL